MHSMPATQTGLDDGAGGLAESRSFYEGQHVRHRLHTWTGKVSHCQNARGWYRVIWYAWNGEPHGETIESGELLEAIHNKAKDHPIRRRRMGW